MDVVTFTEDGVFHACLTCHDLIINKDRIKLLERCISVAAPYHNHDKIRIVNDLFWEICNDVQPVALGH